MGLSNPPLPVYRTESVPRRRSSRWNGWKGNQESKMTTTLLELLAKHTTIDFDSNDANQVALFPKSTFTDMTSNQAILWNELQKDINKKRQLAKLAVEEAQTLVEQQVEGASGRDISTVAVDIIAVKLALEVLPFLKQNGRVHSQTSVFAARSYQKTLTHARNLISLFNHYGVPPSRVCIKIPATTAGLRACKTLVEEGSEAGTLATIVCCEAQAIAAGEIGVTYVAPYVNPLEVHFVDGTYVDQGPHGLEGFRVAAVAQKSFADRNIKTKVMAASIVNIQEALCLAGLSHSTLSSTVLLSLLSTPSTATHEAFITQSLAFYSSSPSSLASYPLPPLGSEDDSEFLPPGCDDKARELTRKALDLFGEFEYKLLETTRKALSAIGGSGD
ncbi:aldolase [Meredithblackwellia eburnea MCA 4105]